jgi:hypothetical protein
VGPLDRRRRHYTLRPSHLTRMCLRRGTYR